MNGTEKQNETSMEMPAEDSRVTMGNQTEKKHRFHLKMPQKGRKHSVKKRIAYTFIATMAATLLIIGLINYFFLGSFYIRDKEHILAESFQKLNEITCFLAMIPVHFYNGKRGLNLKYPFYAFYPVHLLVLFAIAAVLGMAGVAVV